MTSSSLATKIQAMLPGGVRAALWRRKYLILSITLVLTTINIGIGLLTPKIYYAQTLLQVDQRAMRVIDGNMSSISPDLDEGRLASQADVIRSPALAFDVINRLGLLGTPEFQRLLEDPASKGPSLRDRATTHLRDLLTAVLPGNLAKSLIPPVSQHEPLPDRVREERVLTYFQRNLRVSYDTRGYSIYIGYSSGDAMQAAAIANTLAAAYVEQQMHRKTELLSNAGGWLDERLQVLRDKAEAAENQLTAFRREHRLGTLQAPAFTQQQLADLNTQFIAALGEETKTNTRQAAAEELARKGRLQDLPEALNSNTIRALREQEVLVQLRVAELNSGGNLRTAADQRAAGADVQRRLAAEHERLFNAIRSEAGVATARRAAIEATIARFTKEAEEREIFAVQAALLEREAVANRTVFDTAVQRTEETRTLNGLQRPDIMIVAEARVPGQPAKPKLSAIGMVGLLTSLTFGAGLALFLEMRKVTIRSIAQGEALLNMASLGWVPLFRSRERATGGLTPSLPKHLMTECLRSVALSMRTLFGRESKVVLVTSAVPGEGKSTFAASFAQTISAAGRSCLLIDADLRRRALTGHFHEPARGLSDLVAPKAATLTDLMVVDQKTGLFFIGGGAQVIDGNSHAADPLRILDNPAFGRLINEARQRFDIVIIDAPPLLSVSDSPLLAQTADLTLLVVGWASTPWRVAEQALDRLRLAGVTAVSFVLNKVDVSQVSRLDSEIHSLSYADACSTAASPTLLGRQPLGGA